MDFDDSPQEAEFRARSATGWSTTTRACRPRRPTTSTGRSRPSGTARCSTAGSSRLTWPKAYGGQELPPVYEVIVDEELAAAGAPPKPGLGYLIQGITRHGSQEICDRFLPALISGRDRWCQGFSEPDAGSDLASLRTRWYVTVTSTSSRATRSGPATPTSPTGACSLRRTDPGVPKHKGISAFAVPMRQPGIEQRPLKMINGVTSEFGQVLFDGARRARRQHDRRAG